MKTQVTTSDEAGDEGIPVTTRAIRETLRCIDSRSRGHRNLVIVFAVILLLPPLVALVFWNAKWLLLWLVAVPTTSLHFTLDLIRVHRWQQRILQYCSEDELRIEHLRAATEINPQIPKDTLQSMLEDLPELERVSKESATTAFEQEMKARLLYSFLATMLLAIATGLGCIAIVAQSWRIAFCAAIILIIHRRIGAHF